MKKLLSVAISVILVFSVGAVSASAAELSDNILNAYLAAMVTLTDSSKEEINNWGDVLKAAKDALANTTGDEAEDYARALDGLNSSLSEFSEDEFDSWSDAITYGSEQIYTDYNLNATELYKAYLGAAKKGTDGAGEGFGDFAEAAAGTADAVIAMFSKEFNDYIDIFTKLFNMFADYIKELAATANFYMP